MMKRTCRFAIPVVLLSMIAPLQASWAEKAHIADQKEVSVKSGPSNDFKSVGKVQPGAEVEVIKLDGWNRVRYQTQGGQTREGWVPTKSLAGLTPEDAKIKAVEDENAALKEQLGQLEREKAELSHKHNELVERLNRENAMEAANNRAASAMASATPVSSPPLENRELATAVRWITIGVPVFFLGTLFGWLLGRSRKKKRSYYI